VNHFAPQIQAVAAADLVARLAKQDSCELVADFAVSLPAEAFLINFGIGGEAPARCCTSRNGDGGDGRRDG
jgi:hypothetical protein